MTKALYIDIAEKLSEAIYSGKYPVGSSLPTEMELCAHFSVSRHTVRAALRELLELGLVSRNKKAGTRVENSQAPSQYSYSLTSLEKLTDFGSTYKREVQSIEKITVDIKLSRLLKCQPGLTMMKISSIRIKDRTQSPVGWTDVYFSDAYSEIADTIRKNPDTLISSLIEKKFGRKISTIQQDITAVIIPQELVQILQAVPDSPALKIIRSYRDHRGETIVHSVSIHPSEKFVFSTRLSRT